MARQEALMQEARVKRAWAILLFFTQIGFIVFTYLELMPEDYELAAEFFNTCRSKGIQGSNTDFLICAVAHCRSYSILSTDNDFQNFLVHIPIILLPVESWGAIAKRSAEIAI
jgi:predicted nucleic acid-binding protein